MPQYNLRRATESDLPKLVAMAKELWLRMPYSFGPSANWDNEKVTETFESYIIVGDINRHGLFVAEASGEIVGAICAITMEPFWNRQKHAFEMFFFVEPSHKRVAFKLMDVMEAWARKIGCKGMLLGIDTNNRRINKGFVTAEQMYYKELN